MFCPNCGKENKDNVQYCKYCGVAFKNNNVDVQEQPINDEDKENKKKNIIIITLVALIAIAAIVCVVIYVSSSNSNNSIGSASEPISYNAFPISQVPTLAKAISDTNYPSSIIFNGLTLTKAQYLHILTTSIVQISNGNSDGSISVGTYSEATNPLGKDSSQTINKGEYVDMCSRFSNWISSKGYIPNYIGVHASGVADISPNKMAQICCEVLIQYGDSGQLPASISI
ncbi:MAG: zinc-ribbon domain-containing protein [archaeon]|nr:zinc-ribbon domain-containing protein [archaeon]MCQ2972221.1 zinc-ribbon domain-containing protein [archaeon]